MAIFIGGCTGGVLQSFLMSPVESVKVSQQCIPGQSLRTASLPVVWNLTHFSSRAWTGLGATLLRDGIPHGVWFVSYEMC
jgi:solute carrier family 25 (mitochondrial carnitine/acylcarnitine transporter), member 20/29